MHWLVFMFPTIGAITLIWLSGTYASAIGILNGILAWRRYRCRKQAGSTRIAAPTFPGIARRNTPDRRIHAGV